MMESVLRSRLTRRSQTTIPKAVKNALNIAAGDDIGYVIEGDSVRLVNASDRAENTDPVLEQFLELVESDIAAGHVVAIPASLLEQIRNLSRGVIVDHDAEIEGAISL